MTFTNDPNDRRRVDAALAVARQDFDQSRIADDEERLLSIG